jgi:hypothetical protein
VRAFVRVMAAPGIPVEPLATSPDTSASTLTTGYTDTDLPKGRIKAVSTELIPVVVALRI